MLSEEGCISDGGKASTMKSIELSDFVGINPYAACRAIVDLNAEVERSLVAAPATTWQEAAEKARYLITLFAATAEAQDPRRRTLIANVFEDFKKLSDAPTETIADEKGGRPRES